MKVKKYALCRGCHLRPSKPGRQYCSDDCRIDSRQKRHRRTEEEIELTRERRSIATRMRYRQDKPPDWKSIIEIDDERKERSFIRKFPQIRRDLEMLRSLWMAQRMVSEGPRRSSEGLHG